MGESAQALELLLLAGDTNNSLSRLVELPEFRGEVMHVRRADGTGGIAVTIPEEESAFVPIKTQVFETEIRMGAPKGFAYLIVQSVESEFPAAFLRMLDDILDRLRSTSVGSTEAVLETIREWRGLFTPLNTDRLTEGKVIGLIAELELIEGLVALNTPVEKLIDAWQFQGPHSEHDFMFENGLSVEVKATSARESFTVSIHGLEQLSFREGEALYLFAEQVELHPDGRTLPEVIEAVRGLVAADKMVKFDRVLHQIGYYDADADLYDAKYRLRRSKTALVDDDMPRLARTYVPHQALAEQIKLVSYSFDFGPVAGHEDESALIILSSTLSGDIW